LRKASDEGRPRFIVKGSRDRIKPLSGVNALQRFSRAMVCIQHHGSQAQEASDLFFP
jgi:hypothetical protein